MNNRALVIGYGSIGERHARVLEKIGLTVDIVSRRSQSGGRAVFPTIADAVKQARYDYCVIANETSLHDQALQQLAAASFDGVVLVEKPLTAGADIMSVADGFRRVGVGYNLRFHPLVGRLKAELRDQDAEMASFHVGQWLPDWRPNRPLTSTYSGSADSGGGVLRDLSHELDLATWLFGPWKRVVATGGRLSDITQDADDAWGILLACECCPLVMIQLNCLDRQGRRTATIQSRARTLHGDLVGGTLTIKGPQDAPADSTAFKLDRDDTYAAMHTAMLEGSSTGCSFEEGLDVVRLIEAIEKSAKDQTWVTRT